MKSPVSLRGGIAYAHDLVMAALSFLISFYLRLGDVIFFYRTDIIELGIVAFTVICAAVFWFTGLYRGTWRYASLSDLLAITRAVSISILAFLVVMFLWVRLEEVPRSVVVINWFILMALLGGPRFLYRLIKDGRIDLSVDRFPDRHRVPVLLVGTRDAAELFIRGVAKDVNYRIVGTLAEKRDRVGQSIHGVPVLGVVEDLPHVVAELGRRGLRPQRLILTRDDTEGAQVRRLLEGAERLGMTLARAPRPTEFRSGVEERVEVRPIAVEDLLGRPQTPLDRDAMRALIHDRRILVTGAGGSIGSELVRQVAACAPAQLTLVESSEFNLYTIDMEIAEHFPALERRPVIADVRDRLLVNRLFAAARPQVVFHAAALKHVPLVELNPVEGVLTNVIGGANVAEASRAAEVEVMVQISTDKAVNPTNVMGATKRIAERYCQALDLLRDGGRGTRFVTVRFGNVLGSTGSVVPLFRRQLAAGGPLTVTHPEMERYFMTIREAVELVLEASALGRASDADSGKIYVLDMGEPVKILDLARQMIRLAGLRPDVDVKIAFIGLRPGEKIREEVFHGAEELLPTACPGIRLAAPRAADAAELAAALRTLEQTCTRGDVPGVLRAIRVLVPEYAPAAVVPLPQAAHA